MLNRKRVISALSIILTTAAIGLTCIALLGAARNLARMPDRPVSESSPLRF